MDVKMTGVFIDCMMSKVGFYNKDGKKLIAKEVKPGDRLFVKDPEGNGLVLGVIVLSQYELIDEFVVKVEKGFKNWCEIMETTLEEVS